MSNHDAPERPLEIGLLVLRLASAAFFLVWSVDKIVNVAHARKVFDKFYFLEITPAVATGLGVVQTLVVLAFMAGYKKTWTYGAVLAMHTVSVASSWEKLVDPYGGGLLFWAAVPLWAALLLLWLVRDRDRLWAVG